MSNKYHLEKKNSIVYRSQQSHSCNNNNKRREQLSLATSWLRIQFGLAIDLLWFLFVSCKIFGRFHQIVFGMRFCTFGYTKYTARPDVDMFAECTVCVRVLCAYVWWASRHMCIMQKTKEENEQKREKQHQQTEHKHTRSEWERKRIATFGSTHWSVCMCACWYRLFLMVFFWKLVWPDETHSY